MTTTTLSERRAGDRKKMALALQELITRCGATFVRDEGTDTVGAQAIRLRVTAPGGLLLRVDLDGKSIQPDIHVLSWHMAFESINRLNDATFGGNVNPYHQLKATYVAYGFEDLCKQLEFGLLHARDGTAYLPAPEPVVT